MTTFLRSALARRAPAQQAAEGGDLVYRKHWAVLIGAAKVPFIMLIIDIAAWSAFPIYHITSASPFGSWLPFFIIALSCIPAPWLWWHFENWHNDYYLVTEDRLIDVEKQPLGMRTEMLEAPLANVQNVSMEIPGLLAASLGFGNVNIETAGRQGPLTFTSVAHPREVMQAIMGRLEAQRAKTAEKERESREEEMADWFSAFQALPRVTMVRNPHSGQAGRPFEVEWRVDGPPGNLQTALYWDVRSRQDPAYRYSLAPQEGAPGNYSGLVVAPLADKVYLRARARWPKGEHWSDEFEIPLDGFRIDIPRAISSGGAIEVRWRLREGPPSMLLHWDTTSHEDQGYAHIEHVDAERAGYACRLIVPRAKALYLRLEANLDDVLVTSPEFVIPIVGSLST